MLTSSTVKDETSSIEPKRGVAHCRAGAAVIRPGRYDAGGCL